MGLVAQGLSNKEIALQLGFSPRTVENYRAWVMEKMGARNLRRTREDGCRARNWGAVTLMTIVGPTRTSQHVRFSAACGGEEDMS